MRHGGGVAYERFYAAQAFCQREELSALQHLYGCFYIVVFQGKGDHAAVAAHLLFGYVVVGVLFKTYPQHLADFWVCLQVAGYLLAILAVALHAHMQGLYTAQHQPAVVRTGYRPAAVLYKAQALFQSLVVHDQCTVHHIAVAAQVLGGAVQHYVGTQVQRILQVGGCKGIVAYQRQLMLFGYLRAGSYIYYVQQWVGRRFYPYHLRIRVDMFGDALCILHTYEVELHTIVGKYLGHQAIRTAIQVVTYYYLIAGQQQLHHRISSGHTAAEAQAILAVLYRSQCILQHGARRVLRTCILIALMVARAGLHISAGLVYRCHYGPCGRVGVHTCMYHLGIQLVFLLFHCCEYCGAKI